MLKKYMKGYRAERHLVHKLSKMGWLAIRSPRSGRIGLPSPDIITAKNKELIAIECKSREQGFKIPMDQLNQLKEWEDKAGAKSFIAWKLSHKDWYFISLKDVIKNNGNIGKKFCEENGKSIESIFGF